MVRRFSSLTTAVLLLWSVAPAFAQDPRATDAPAHISLVEGVAALERDGRIEDAPANMPILAGDRVRTRTGRVEILFADGSTLHLDHNTAIDLQSDELVRLLDGRIRLSIPVHARDVAYRIDGPNAWAQVSQPGDYRAAVIQNAGVTELEFAVLRGAAELMNEDGRTPLRAGERAFARANAAPSYAYVFNSMSMDPFDRWSEARRGERLGISTQYLPDEVRPYSTTFDSYGSWQYESSYGYVWYPRVDYGWRPYYRGRWSTLRPYGWTWIGNDPWAWPTHHYGRWGFNAGVWFWIPGRQWAPAWVSWAYAPGYVSWCPLGWNNRPVVQIVNVNVYRGFDPWRAWTVLPQRSFGVGLVHRNVINGVAIDARTRSAFAQRDSGPVVTGYAVPRSPGSAPIRVAGTDASRRGLSTPLLTNRGTAPPPVSRSSAPVATPSRPMVRSDRDARVRSLPEAAPEAPRAQGRMRSYEPTRPEANTPQDRRSAAPREAGPGYRPDPTYATGSPSEGPSRRAIPRGEYARPGTESVPTRVDRPSYGGPSGYERRQPSAERPSPGPPGGFERRPPSIDRPSPPSGPAAQPSRPERSGPPPAAAPPGGRGRPADAPSRGTAVRRPGGGR